MALRDVSEFFCGLRAFFFRLQVSARIGHKPASGRRHKVSKHSFQLGKRRSGVNRSRSGGGVNVKEVKVKRSLPDVLGTHVR